MSIKELHRKAMEIADTADFQKAQGNKEESISSYEKSYRLESKAAITAHRENIGEPAVSILLRSAASLAIICQKDKEAEKLIALALNGEPPAEIAEELQELRAKCRKTEKLSV